MKCPKCGSECKEGAKVCASCGKELKAKKSNNKNIEVLDDSEEKEQTSPVEELEFIDEELLSAQDPEIYESEFMEDTSMNIPNPLVELQRQLEEEKKNKKKKARKKKPEKKKNAGVKQEKSKKSKSVAAKKKSENIKTELEKNIKSLFVERKLAGSIITLIAIIAVILLSIFAAKILFSSLKNETKYLNDIYSEKKLIPIKEKGKYGYINTKGKLIIPAQYIKAGIFSDGYALVEKETSSKSSKKKTYQIINKRGKVKVESKEKITHITDQGLWVVNKAIYNRSLNKITADDMEVDYESDGYFTWTNSKEKTGGILNNKGKVTYKYSFKEDEDYISVEISKTDDTLKENYCRVNVSSTKYAIVNCKTGEIIQDYIEDYIQTESNNIFQVKDPTTYQTKKTFYIANNKIIYETEDENISLDYYPGYLQIRDGSKPYSERYTYMDLQTLKISKERPVTDDSSVVNLSEWEKLRSVKTINCGANYGLAHDKDVILPCEWQNIKPLGITLYKYLANKGHDYVYAKKDNTWNLVNLKNKKIIASFDSEAISATDFSPFIYYTDTKSSKKRKHIYNIFTKKSLEVADDTEISLYSNYVTVKDSKAKETKFYNNKLEHIYTQKD